MRRFIGIILLAALLAGCVPGEARRVDVEPLPSPTAVSLGGASAEEPADGGQPAPAPSDSGEWQELAPGLEFREISANITNVQIVRVDPRRYSLRVAYDAGEPGRVSQWADALKPLLVINGGYFDKQGRATALTIYDGVAYGSSYDGFGGMFAVDTSGAATLRSLREEPYDPGEALAQALQSTPMLVLHGEQVPQPNDDGDRARRSVVATDGAGNILFIVCSWPTFTLSEFSAWLVDQRLGIANALNLDGGSSTGMALDAPGRSFVIDSLARVPQVLVVEGR